mmetsp:Transcript_16635/g.45708  ORF Transcript_16635/g.45708 Transcript_16635/m.45708 type:complete len:370 (-) Transcript_16635:748-1857(-)
MWPVYDLGIHGVGFPQRAVWTRLDKVRQQHVRSMVGDRPQPQPACHQQQVRPAVVQRQRQPRQSLCAAGAQLTNQRARVIVGSNGKHVRVIGAEALHSHGRARGHHGASAWVLRSCFVEDESYASPKHFGVNRVLCDTLVSFQVEGEVRERAAGGSAVQHLGLQRTSSLAFLLGLRRSKERVLLVLSLCETQGRLLQQRQLTVGLRLQWSHGCQGQGLLIRVLPTCLQQLPLLEGWVGGCRSSLHNALLVQTSLFHCTHTKDGALCLPPFHVLCKHGLLEQSLRLLLRHAHCQLHSVQRGQHIHMQAGELLVSVGHARHQLGHSIIWLVPAGGDPVQVLMRLPPHHERCLTAKALHHNACAAQHVSRLV